MNTYALTQATGHKEKVRRVMSDIIVLKCGGSTIDTLSDSFFKNVKKLQEKGLKPILVHGGGPAIEAMLTKLDIKAEFVNGLRKTTEQVMEVVEMVLTGDVNNSLTRKLNQVGIQAVGLSGCDANLLVAKQVREPELGYVGEVIDVNIPLIHTFLDKGIVPVIAPVGIGSDGVLYNVNADTAAGAVAKAVQAKQLVFVTDVPGIMRENKLLQDVTENEINKLIKQGVIYGGMIPKVKAALASLSHDLQEVMIVDGNQTVLTNGSRELVGTTIKKAVEVV